MKGLAIWGGEIFMCYYNERELGDSDEMINSVIVQLSVVGYNNSI